MKHRALVIIAATFFVFAAKGFSIDATLIKTVDVSYADKWSATPSKAVPEISSTDHVFRHQYFFIRPIIWGFSLKGTKKADVTFSLKMTAPDGSTYLDQDKMVGLNGVIDIPENLQMSSDAIKMSFEDKDPIGSYKIIVLITDNNSGEIKKLETEVKLIEYAPKKLQFTDTEYEGWISNYYQNPQPESLLDSFLYYVNSPISQNNSSALPIMHFYAKVLDDNEYLIPKIFNIYSGLAQSDERDKVFLLYLLALTQKDNSDYVHGLTEEEEQLYLKVKNQNLPDIYGEITSPVELDMLWSTFFATGLIRPIEKLVSVLDWAQYAGAIDNYGQSKQTAEDRTKAIRESIYKSAAWSIKSNCSQHPLVKEYCTFLLFQNGLSEVSRSELKKILDSL